MDICCLGQLLAHYAHSQCQLKCSSPYFLSFSFLRRYISSIEYFWKRGFLLRVLQILLFKYQNNDMPLCAAIVSSCEIFFEKLVHKAVNFFCYLNAREGKEPPFRLIYFSPSKITDYTTLSVFLCVFFLLVFLAVYWVVINRIF
jgi:hypothetical protein